MKPDKKNTDSENTRRGTNWRKSTHKSNSHRRGSSIVMKSKLELICESLIEASEAKGLKLEGEDEITKITYAKSRIGEIEKLCEAIQNQQQYAHFSEQDSNTLLLTGEEQIMKLKSAILFNSLGLTPDILKGFMERYITSKHSGTLEPQKDKDFAKKVIRAANHCLKNEPYAEDEDSLLAKHCKWLSEFFSYIKEHTAEGAVERKSVGIQSQPLDLAERLTAMEILEKAKEGKFPGADWAKIGDGAYDTIVNCLKVHLKESFLPLGEKTEKKLIAMIEQGLVQGKDGIPGVSVNEKSLAISIKDFFKPKISVNKPIEGSTKGYGC